MLVLTEIMKGFNSSYRKKIISTRSTESIGRKEEQGTWQIHAREMNINSEDNNNITLYLQDGELLQQFL